MRHLIIIFNFVILTGCTRDVSTLERERSEPKASGATDEALETFVAEIVDIHDSGKRAITWVISFERVGDQQLRKCEMHMGHPFLQALGYEQRGYQDIHYSREKDGRRFPRFKVTIAGPHNDYDKMNTYLAHKLVRWEKIKE